MRAYVHKDTCISCETCVEICPKVFLWIVMENQLL